MVIEEIPGVASPDWLRTSSNIIETSRPFHPAIVTLAPPQDGGIHVEDILASFPDSGRKWRRGVRLYLPSVVHNVFSAGYYDQY